MKHAASFRTCASAPTRSIFSRYLDLQRTLLERRLHRHQTRVLPHPALLGRGGGCILHLEGQRDTVGGEVVCPRVCEVIPESHKWALAGCLVLRHKAHERTHRQASVLDLLHWHHAVSATAWRERNRDGQRITYILAMLASRPGEEEEFVDWEARAAAPRLGRCCARRSIRALHSSASACQRKARGRQAPQSIYSRPSLPQHTALRHTT